MENRKFDYIMDKKAKIMISKPLKPKENIFGKKKKEKILRIPGLAVLRMSNKAVNPPKDEGCRGRNEEFFEKGRKWIATQEIKSMATEAGYGGITHLGN